MWTREVIRVGKPDQKSPYIDNCFVLPSAYIIFAQSDYFTDDGNIMNRHTLLPHQYQSKSVWLISKFCLWLFAISYFLMINCPPRKHVDFKNKRKRKITNEREISTENYQTNKYGVAAGYRIRQTTHTT